MTYRNEIDGLRAIAVLAVLNYHLGVNGFGGGFVGVDIFFVISGYVIFRSIKPQLITGTFEARRFIKRRIYRLQPALFVTLLASIPFAFRILAPAELESFGTSLLAAAFGVANLHFNDNAGNYFAALAETQPLLHTWSLGVEEQFYLIAMVFFSFASARRSYRQLTLPLALLSLLGFSLNLFDIYISGKYNRSFYFPIHRFWELGCGALLALHEPAKRPTLFGRNLLPSLALAGVLASVILVKNDDNFPGALALLPVLSTALLILSTGKGSWVHTLLSSTPMAGIGKISYSLYLVHWPIIVLTTLAKGTELEVADQAFIFIASLVLATALWRWVEVPFRMKGRNDAPPPTHRLLIPSLALLCSIGIVLNVLHGVPGRLPSDAQALLVIDAQNESMCEDSRHWHIPKATICGNFQPDHPIDVLVWGDSHADALKPGLLPLLTTAGLSTGFVTMPHCPPLIGIYTSRLKNREECRQLAETLLSRVSSGGIRMVVLASRWANLESPAPSPGNGSISKTLYDSDTGSAVTFAQALTATIASLRDRGAQVLIVGPVPEMEFDVPQTLMRAKLNDFTPPPADRAGFEWRQSAILPALRAAQEQGVSVFFPHEYLCDPESCRFVENGAPLYLDDDHLSPQGAALVATPLLSLLRKQLTAAPISEADQ